MAAWLKICVAKWLSRCPHLLVVVLVLAGGLALAPQASAVALGADLQPGTAFTYDGTHQVESNRVVVWAVPIRFVDREGGAAGLASAAGGHLYDVSHSLVAPTSALDDLAAAACRTNSFVPSTAVLMTDGLTKPIEDVEIGDWVWAHDPETGETGPRRVIDTIAGHGPKHLVDIGVAGGVITATEQHPFWVDGKGRWVGAGSLESGDRLLVADGSTVPVESVASQTAIRTVHNLTIEGVHTYYVVADDVSVLVHNCTIGHKIRDQMADRGWTEALVNDVVDNPTFTHNVWDLTTDSAATAYARGDNFYVVVNDATGEVVQISDRLDSGWGPVWNDSRFDPPG